MRIWKIAGLSGAHRLQIAEIGASVSAARPDGAEREVRQKSVGAEDTHAFRRVGWSVYADLEQYGLKSIRIAID